MTDPTRPSAPAGGAAEIEQQGERPVIRDRRRLDPLTGEVRHPGAPRHAHHAEPSGPADGGVGAVPNGSEAGPDGQVVADLEAVVKERLDDLLRLQAEFLNYKRRVERDRDLARAQAVGAVLEALLPVLDDIHAARLHGALDGGPFAAIAEKLEQTLARFGLVRYGEPGEIFDPTLHEALMHTEAEAAEGLMDTTVVQVLQPGYRTSDKVLRAARVAVADPP